MSSRRIYLFILILLGVISALAGVMGNIAVDVLPPHLAAYKWLAWPIFIILIIAGAVLVVIQHRLEKEQHVASQNEPDSLNENMQNTPISFSDNSFNEIQFRNLELANKQNLQILSSPLTWDYFRTIAHQITAGNMSGAVAKFDPNLYIPRAALQSTFEDFLKSDKVCFILLGKSGVGKTNFFLALEQNSLANRQDLCVLLYDATAMNSMLSIPNSLALDFKMYLPGTPFLDVLQEIARVPGINSKKVILGIDAINENSQPVLLLKQIDEIVRKSCWPWLKIVITSRPEAWRLFSSTVYAGEERYYQPSDRSILGEDELFHSTELRSFTPNEMQSAYEKYQIVYQLKTPFTALSEETKLVLQDPLILRIEAQMHRQDNIPQNINMRSVVKDYIKFLIGQKTTVGRLTEQDLLFLQYELMPLMVGGKSYINKITAAMLQVEDQTRPKGKKLSDQLMWKGPATRQSANQSFINLVDAYILSHQGQGESFRIFFTYEMYWDYFTGQYLFGCFQSLQGLTEKTKFITGLVQQTRDHPFMFGPAINLLFLVLDLGTDSHEVFLRVASSSNRDCQDLIASVLLEYYQIHPELVKSLLLDLWHVDRKRKQFMPGDENRALVAVEVAGVIANIDVLLDALHSRRQRIRDRAVVATYKLWCQNQSAGNLILKNLVEHIGLFTLLFNSHVIQSSLALSILIFFNHFSDPSGCGLVVLDIWKPSLRRFFLYNPTSVHNQRIMSLFRNRVLALLINIVSNLLKSIPSRYNVISLLELRAVYKLPQPVKNLALEIVKFLEPGQCDQNDLCRLLNQLFDMEVGGRPVNNMLLKLLIDYVLVAQGQVNLEQTLVLVNELMERELARPIPAKRIMWDKSWVYSALAFLQTNIDENLFRAYSNWVNRCHQEVNQWEGSAGFYAYLGYADYARIYYKKYGDIQVQTLRDLLVWSLMMGANQKALDILEELGYLAGSPLWKVPLFVMEPILGQLASIEEAGDEPISLREIKDKTIEILAIVNTRHPYATRSFLLANKLPAAFIEQVRIRKVAERVAGDLLKGGLGTWGQFELLQGFSPGGRPYLVRIFLSSFRAKNLSRFLADLAGTAINLVMEGPVFLVTLGENK